MKNTYRVTVGRRTITLPTEWRTENEIGDGDTLTLVDLGDGIIALATKRSRVDKLADALAEAWRDSGMTLESMLKTLRDVREKHDRTVS